MLDNSWVVTVADGKDIVLGGLTSAYVTDYRCSVEGHRRSVDAQNAPQTDFVRYPKKESIEGLKGLRTASECVPDTSWLERFTAVPGLHVLMSHHPEYLPLVPKTVDLMLSGHAHGGQWRIFNHGMFAPGQGWWPKWTKGVYEGRLVVSAGLANTAHVPRIFNPTEVVFIEPH